MSASAPGSAPESAKPGRAGAVALSVVTAAVVILGYGYLRAPRATRVHVGDPAPDLALPSLGGGRTRLADFQGRPVLLVVLQYSCEACRAELSEIEHVHREFLQRGLVVLGVAIDEQIAPIRALVDRHELTFLVLEDPGGRGFAEAFGTPKPPERYLIDAQGRVVAVEVGEIDWRTREWRGRIRALLPPELAQ